MSQRKKLAEIPNRRRKVKHTKKKVSRNPPTPSFLLQPKKKNAARVDLSAGARWPESGQPSRGKRKKAEEMEELGEKANEKWSKRKKPQKMKRKHIKNYETLKWKHQKNNKNVQKTWNSSSLPQFYLFSQIYYAAVLFRLSSWLLLWHPWWERPAVQRWVEGRLVEGSLGFVFWCFLEDPYISWCCFKGRLGVLRFLTGS